MGLADDITDRALQAHMADLKAAKGSDAEGSSGIPSPQSRDSTKNLGQAVKQIGAAPKYSGLFNGSVKAAAVTGMPTKQYTVYGTLVPQMVVLRLPVLHCLRGIMTHIVLSFLWQRMRIFTKCDHSEIVFVIHFVHRTSESYGNDIPAVMCTLA